MAIVTGDDGDIQMRDPDRGRTDFGDLDAAVEELASTNDWGPDRLVGLLLTYIERQSDPQALLDFLKTEAEDE